MDVVLVPTLSMFPTSQLSHFAIHRQVVVIPTALRQ